MKKVGIYTLNGNNNFGNKLQNYALIEALKKHGCKVNTIWFYRKNRCITYIKKIIKKVLMFYDKESKREARFEKFTKKYLNRIYYKMNYCINDSYDFFIVGSDQVWNYNFKGFNESYFLNFVDERKRIAYAASFGVNTISDEYVGIFRKGLSGIPYISVRENDGKTMVEKITNRNDIKVLIDPTMLLTKDDWDIIAKKPKKLKNEKYILNYFLGELSIERKREIERVAKKYNCKIINILDKDDKFYNCDPSEFLYLEKNAFLICTDSFHSSVFAIIYNRPFIIFDREDKVVSMKSRIDTLIQNFNLVNRKFNGKIEEENLQNDYRDAYRILEIERKKANEFLENALA